MITVTIAGEEKSVTGGGLSMPRVGIWLGDLEVNGEAIPSGNIVATLAGVDMPAHIQRASLVEGLLKLRVVGGAGGMGKQTRAKHYRNPTVSHVLGDLARDAGEILSPSCTSAALDTPLPYWTTLAGTLDNPMTTGAMVQALADIVGNGCAWRILYDGKLWFGRETWPACPADVRIISQDAHNATQKVGTDVSGIWPGTTMGGRQIDHVQHDFNGTPRSIVTFVDGHT
jgi:hypothetical protein